MQPRYQFQVVDISSANVDGTRGVESRKKEKVGLLGKPNDHRGTCQLLRPVRIASKILFLPAGEQASPTGYPAVAVRQRGKQVNCQRRILEGVTRSVMDQYVNSDTINLVVCSQFFLDL
jgi:hypothetical protein